MSSYRRPPVTPPIIFVGVIAVIAVIAAAAAAAMFVTVHHISWCYHNFTGYGKIVAQPTGTLGLTGLYVENHILYT